MVISWFIKDYFFRLAYVLVAGLLSFVLAYSYKEALLAYVLNPYILCFSTDNLLVTRTQDLFMAQIFLSIVVSSFIAFILFLGTTLHYFIPGMYQYEARLVACLFGILLFAEAFFIYSYNFFIGNLLKFWVLYFYPTHLDLFYFRVDITVINYLNLYVFLLIFLNLVLILLYLFVVFIFVSEFSFTLARYIRVWLNSLIFLVVVFVAPPEPLLHIFLFLSLNIIFELIIFIWCSISVYGEVGRVA